MKSESRRPRRLRRLLVCAGLTVAVAVAGCVVANESDRADEISAQELRRGHHFTGPVSVVIDVAREHAELSPDQALAIDAIAADLEVGFDTKSKAKERFRSSAADIVRTGATDSEQFEEAIDDVLVLAERHMQSVDSAMVELHLTLDADQRVIVAKVLHERIEEHFRKHRVAGVDHAAVDRAAVEGADVDRAAVDRVGHEHAAQQDSEGGTPKRRVGFKRVAKHLVLSTLQIDKLKALRRELAGTHKRARPCAEELHVLVDAFEGKDAEGRSFEKVITAFHAEKLEILKQRFTRASERADTALSILSDGQRDLLADLIERGPRKVLFEEQSDVEAVSDGE